MLDYGAAALEQGFGFVRFFIHPHRRTAQDRLAETIGEKETPTGNASQIEPPRIKPTHPTRRIPNNLLATNLKRRPERCAEFGRRENVAMDEFHIRVATLEDLPYILRHRRAMFRDMRCGDDPNLDEVVVTAETFLGRTMPTGGYRRWLAIAGDECVAAGAGITIVPWPGAPRDPVPRRGWIQNVYTEPEFRRRGLARRLMETVVGWCDEGFYTVSLHASADGRALYKSLGFRDTNEMRLTL